MHMSMVVPPNGAGLKAEGPSEADLQEQVSAGKAAASDIFGPGLAEKELRAVDASVAMQRGGNFRTLAGGINNLDIHSINIDASGSTAVVTGTVEVWSRTSLKNPDGAWHQAVPHNSIDFTMTLTNQNHWIVETFDWSFAPGSEP